MNNLKGDVVNTVDMINEALAAKGWKVKIVPLGYLDSLKAGLEKVYSEMSSKAFSGYIKRRFDFKIDKDGGMKSIIIIAVPSPQSCISVKWGEAQHQIIVPPTYLDYDAIDEQVKCTLSNILNRDNYLIESAMLPEKLLAVHCGLGRYGKNNLCYIDGMGSFFRLVSFVSDIPSDNFTWQDITLNNRCSHCNICASNCPTGAIAPGKFLIDASICLTFLNERQGQFPEWLNPKVHNCLIGCMKCQLECPENISFRENIRTRGAFSENEVSEIIKTKRFNDLGADLQAKLRDASLHNWYSVLSRNFQVLLEA